MKQLLMACCILSVYVFTVGCSCSSDVMAVYNGNEITRGQFKQWLLDKQFSDEAVFASKKQQKEKLESMALEDIAVKEAEKQNLIVTEKYVFLEEMAFESVLLKELYDRKVKETAEYNEPAYHIKQILLRVRDFKIVNNRRVNLSQAELEKAFADAHGRAAQIIERIKKGESFEEIAKLYSDDFSKKSGGDIGFVIEEMLPVEIFNAVKNMDSGLAESPVKTTQGVYIIKLADKKNITKKNVNKIIKDEMQAKRVEQILLRKASNAYIHDLMNAKDITFHEKSAVSRNPKDVIFSVGDSTYTVEDLQKRISFFQQKGKHAKSPPVDNSKMIDIAKNSFKVALLKRAALQENIHENEEFQREVENRRKMLIAGEYMDYVGGKDVSFSAKDIRDEYEKNKETRFSHYTTKDGKQVKQILPFPKVEEQIESMLHRKKRADNLAKWKRDILHVYKFRINENELEGT